MNRLSDFTIHDVWEISFNAAVEHRVFCLG